MVKFNPYKINPFKIMTVLGWVLKIVLLILALSLFCYASVLSVWDSWGWWALTMPLILIVGFAAGVTVFVLIGYGYAHLKSNYEEAKWRHDQDERVKKIEAQEARTAEMEKGHV